MSEEMIEEMALEANKEFKPIKGQDRLDNYRAIQMLIARGIMGYNEIERNMSNLMLVIGDQLLVEDLEKIRIVLYSNLMKMISLAKIMKRYEPGFNKKIEAIKTRQAKIEGVHMPPWMTPIPPELMKETDAAKRMVT